MRHYIIVRFKEWVDWRSHVPVISTFFKKASVIDGVNNISINTSCSELPNRHHLMIEMVVTAEGLINFDNSTIHSEWKEKYGELIKEKTIFDCAT